MLKRLICTSVLTSCLLANAMGDDNDDKHDYLKIGGAFRFNAALENYENSNNALDTYAKLDTWYLSVDTRQKGFDLSAQYRFYPESKAHFLHHAYIGYAATSDVYFKLGVFAKPFGIADFASHSWWFQAPYYVGLEDTYSTGIGYTHNHDKWTWDVAYFRQAAPRGSIGNNSEDTAVGNGRYSYAIVQSDGADIRELDQWNARLRYQLNDVVEIGASAQLGSVYNKQTDNRRWAYATALHLEANYSRWNAKTEVVAYDYKASDDAGNNMDVVKMAAYGSAYDVATRAMVYVAGVSYDIPVNRRFIQSIRPYVDYSLVDKSKTGFRSTQQLIPGAMIVSGPVVTYVDFAFARNHPALSSHYGDTQLGKGCIEKRWNSRFNINIGYYF